MIHGGLKFELQMLELTYLRNGPGILIDHSNKLSYSQGRQKFSYDLHLNNMTSSKSRYQIYLRTKWDYVYTISSNFDEITSNFSNEQFLNLIHC